MIPITYQADRSKVESIMLAAAATHAVSADSIAADARQVLHERFGVAPIDLVPKVFFRITDNWLELTVRFLVDTHGIRNVKDAMSRVIVDELDKVGIGIASATYDIVGFPPIEIRNAPATGRGSTGSKG